MEAPRTRTCVLLLALLAATLTSCGSNADNPVTPPVDEGHPAPTRMITIVGTPRVKVNFTGSMIESAVSQDVIGSFSVFFTDSLGRRVFLNDVRLAGIPMHEERDPTLGLPSRYTLNTTELPPDIVIGDTLRFEVRDGADISPPFTYVIVPPHITMPPDSSIIHRGVDIVLPFSGIVERVLVTFVDQAGTRIRYNLQIENYSGQTSVYVRGSDLNTLALGDVSLGSDMLDTELFLEGGSYLQSISMNTKQGRDLRLDP